MNKSGWCVACPDHEACSQGACYLNGGPNHPIASPGGIPPWNPPENGELLAYEGWAEWVEQNGNFSQRLQLLAYRFETFTKIFSTALVASARTAAESVNRFVRSLAQPRA